MHRFLLGKKHSLSFCRGVKAHHAGIVLCTATTLLTSKCYADSLGHTPATMIAPIPVNSITPMNMSSLKVVKGDKTTNAVVKKRWNELVSSAKKVLKYFKRLLTYALLGTPAVVMGSTAKYIGYVVPEVEDLIWDYCIWAIQRLGPTFIKMAQWASTRPDLYPPRLIGRLCALQDDVKVNYPFSTVENTLREAFGDNWREKFVVDPKPIGAGCVAQVFRAKMKQSSGKENIDVAIKMIHPHVEQIVETDMELLNMLGAWLDKFESMEMLNLGEVMSDFSDVMRQQLDLRIEAFNLEKFSSKFKHDSWALFPLPIEGCVKKNVLVETLMDGIPIARFMDLKDELHEKAGKLKLRLSDLGTNLILKMIFFDNFIHGDLHPGNILVQFTPNGEPRLVVLDCGIIFESKSEEEHKRLVDVCLAFMQHDGRRAGELMMSKARKSTDLQKTNFCDAMSQIVKDSETMNYFEHMGSYFTKVCDAARDCNVKLDVGYYNIAMALKVVEGIALNLNRSLDLISTCVPVIMKAKAMRALGVEKFPISNDKADDYSKIADAVKASFLLEKKEDKKSIQ